jgi:hypothetical protein
MQNYSVLLRSVNNGNASIVASLASPSLYQLLAQPRSLLRKVGKISSNLGGATSWQVNCYTLPDFVSTWPQRGQGPFPGCPPVEVIAIAAHATVRGSGRVGRTAAGKALEEGALAAAVIAAIRHNHTHYDELLMSGSSRVDARDAVRDDVARTLDLWRKPAS